MRIQVGGALFTNDTSSTEYPQRKKKKKLTTEKISRYSNTEITFPTKKKITGFVNKNLWAHFIHRNKYLISDWFLGIPFCQYECWTSWIYNINFLLISSYFCELYKYCFEVYLLIEKKMIHNQNMNSQNCKFNISTKYNL